MEAVMVLQAIDTYDVIRVESLVLHVYSDPGVGKSTLGNMAEGTLTLDYDKGLHRAIGRQRSMRVETWGDTEAVLKHPWFEECKLLVIDTTGRALDLLADDIIAGDAKLGTALGGLNQRGWGALKERFRVFFRAVRSRGKDVLLISHAKLDKDKDGGKTAIPDIQGGSAGEVFKVSDAMAYYSIVGGKRVLDFNATDNHVGKNPAAWEPIVVPTYASDPKFLGNLFQKLKDHLNALSEEQAFVLQGVAEWQAAIEGYDATPEAMTAALAPLDAIEHPAVKAQAKTLHWRRAKALGFDFDKEAKAFVAKPKEPEKPADAPPATEPPKAAETKTEPKGKAPAKGAAQEPAA